MATDTFQLFVLPSVTSFGRSLLYSRPLVPCGEDVPTPVVSAEVQGTLPKHA